MLTAFNASCSFLPARPRLALTLDLEMVTFDQGFKSFPSLKLRLLKN